MMFTDEDGVCFRRADAKEAFDKIARELADDVRAAGGTEENYMDECGSH